MIQAQGDGELTIKAGDYVDVFMQENQNGWCKVYPFSFYTYYSLIKFQSSQVELLD